MDALEGSDCFLVDFKVKPTNNYKIYLDSDSGFTLEKSIQFNRLLRRRIEEAALYPEGDYSLEVSSPGVDSPLTLTRQYRKNIGRKLEIVLQDAEAAGITGRLKSVDETEIVVEKISRFQRSHNDAAPVLMHIPFHEIKTATVQIEF